MRKNPYVVTGPETPVPASWKGMIRPVSGIGPEIAVPSTSRSSGLPHRVRVRSATSPPVQLTLPETTSTPCANRSRVWAVSTVSVTTG